MSTCKDPQREFERRCKIGLAQKGKTISEKQRQLISKANTGRKMTDATREKMSISNKLRPPKSESTRKKIGDLQRGVPESPEVRKSRCGANSSRWKGGISFEPYCVKFNKEFKERVRLFFGNRCVECGTNQNKKRLHVHHVNFDKMSCCNDTQPLFVPLCSSCHMKTNSNREYWEAHFTDIINKNYGGKCYISKDEIRERSKV